VACTLNYVWCDVWTPNKLCAAVFMCSMDVKLSLHDSIHVVYKTSYGTVGCNELAFYLVLINW
jgi:hypothetical protein